MVKLVLLGIHGVGNADTGFYDQFENQLATSLSRAGIDHSDYAFHGILYSSLFEKEEDKISEMTASLKYPRLRRFISHWLGDALAYQMGVSTGLRIDFYQQVHQLIEQELLELVETEGIDASTPVLVIGHSLGAYIISNYIWDRQRDHPESQSLVDMATLSGIVSLGCNIPILTLGFNYDKLYPIALPGSAITDNPAIQWNNLYSSYDPLSLPLEDFYSAATEAQQQTLTKITDIQLNLGGLVSKYTPFSHLNYWTDKQVIKQITNQISQLLSDIAN